VQRDWSVKAPIDAHDGALGIEHLDVKTRLKSVTSVSEELQVASAA